MVSWATTSAFAGTEFGGVAFKDGVGNKDVVVEMTCIVAFLSKDRFGIVAKEIAIDGLEEEAAKVSIHITPCGISDHKRDDTLPIEYGNVVFEVVNCDFCDVDATNNETGGGPGDREGCTPKTWEDKLLGNIGSKVGLYAKLELGFIMLLLTTDLLVWDAPQLNCDCYGGWDCINAT